MGTTPMISPDGRFGDVPSDRVQDGLKLGGKIGVNVLSPDGKAGTIPLERLNDAIKLGAKIHIDTGDPSYPSISPTPAPAQNDPQDNRGFLGTLASDVWKMTAPFHPGISDTPQNTPGSGKAKFQQATDPNVAANVALKGREASGQSTARAIAETTWEQGFGANMHGFDDAVKSGDTSQALAHLLAPLGPLAIQEAARMGKAKFNDALGSTIAKHFGLSPDYASQVADTVQKIQTERASSASQIKDITAQSEQAGRGIDAQKMQAIQGVTSQLEQDMNALEGQASARTSRLEGQQTALQGQKTETGRQLLADTSQAIVQEKDKVSAPFDKIAESVKGPVTDTGTIDGIIKQSVADSGGKPAEIPGAATRALGNVKSTAVRALTSQESQASVMAKTLLDQGTKSDDVRSAIGNLGFVPKQVEAIMGSLGEESTHDVGFNDLTRVREDLYQSAQASKDTAIRRGLIDAHEKVTALQEDAAQKAGQGDEYKQAKTNYMKFMRGPGSPMMSDLLSAEDAKQQAIAPKLAKLTTPATAEALRAVLKPLGVDVGPLDKLQSDLDNTKQQLKEVGPAQTDFAQKLKGMAKEQIGQASSEAKQSQSELAKETSGQIGDVQSASREAIGDLQAKGKIIPGMNTEDLAGMPNEDINAQRLQTILKNSGSKGIPMGVVTMTYGLVRMLSGSPFGAMAFGYGAGRTFLPELVKEPAFQRWALDKAGIAPGSVQAFKFKVGLVALSPILARAQQQSKPQVSGSASIGDQLRAKVGNQ